MEVSRKPRRTCCMQHFEKHHETNAMRVPGQHLDASHGRYHRPQRSAKFFEHGLVVCSSHYSPRAQHDRCAQVETRLHSSATTTSLRTAGTVNSLHQTYCVLRVSTYRFTHNHGTAPFGTGGLGNSTLRSMTFAISSGLAHQ